MIIWYEKGVWVGLSGGLAMCSGEEKIVSGSHQVLGDRREKRRSDGNGGGGVWNWS